MAAIPRPAYAGPQCPRCRAPLPDEQLHDGANVCLQCLGDFEARVFRPPQRNAHVFQLAQSGPEGATSCANHARNAAVAACERCGLLICSLCQLDVAGSKVCPSCFERMSQEGGESDTTKTRFRDYGSLAAVVSFAGLIFSVFLGIPLGLVSIYFAWKGLRNREARSSLTMVILAIILALGDMTLGSLFLIGIFAKK